MMYYNKNTNILSFIIHCIWVYRVRKRLVLSIIVRAIARIAFLARQAVSEASTHLFVQHAWWCWSNINYTEPQMQPLGTQ